MPWCTACWSKLEAGTSFALTGIVQSKNGASHVTDLKNDDKSSDQSIDGEESCDQPKDGSKLNTSSKNRSACACFTVWPITSLCRKEKTRSISEHVHQKALMYSVFWVHCIVLLSVRSLRPPRGRGGTPLYKLGMCRPKGYGFEPFWSENGYTYFDHFGLK